MSGRTIESPSSPAPILRMRGSVKRRILIAILVFASGIMAYRLLFLGGEGKPASPGLNAGRTFDANSGTARDLSLGRSTLSSGGQGESEVDPSLHLDLLNNSRAVNYTGSKRNTFVFGAASPS